ncbi:MAG TPA: hypothetical protein DDW65_15525, partial [Firmicutes bacterium]|nr:hypothetical protein [Bacillota bacterium]
YFNARWYDPELGRFISEDPAADPNNPNLYSYCGNNGVIRSDPNGQFWWIVIGAIIGGINAERNGGNFWTGAFVGAVSGVISWGVSSAFSGMLGESLTTSVLSGAVGGGITNSAFGGDFWEGAGQGALSGALTWGANQLWGEQLTQWAGDDAFKMAAANAFNSGVVGGAMGGNPVEAAATGAAYSAGGSIFDKFIPKLGTFSTKKFDPNNIKEVIVLNDSTNVCAQGHTAILYIDANGNGMYFSYNPIDTTAHGPAEMRYKELNPVQTTKLLNTGQIGKVNLTTGAVIRTTKDAERSYDRFIRFDVTPDKGSQMFGVAQKYWNDPGTYDLLKHNCSQVVSNMLNAGGISYSSVARPNVAFNNAIKAGEYTDVWKIVNKKVTRDF